MRPTLWANLSSEKFRPTPKKYRQKISPKKSRPNGEIPATLLARFEKSPVDPLAS
jgi:hypothetical protein